MRDLLQAWQTLNEQGVSTVLCRLVETRGSTPQKPGAAMLILPDGSQRGTLGGGCVEAEVKREALLALQSGTPQLLAMSLDDDYGWGDGHICGGRMAVLIEPLAAAPAAEYYQTLVAELATGKGCWEWIGLTEHAPLPKAACLLSAADGTTRTALRTTLMTLPLDPPELARRPKPSVEHGAALLPHPPRSTLILIGGGHVGEALAQLATQLDFDVTVVDDRPEFVTPDRFPTARERLSGNLESLLAGLAITPATFCVIVTRGHQHDEEALFHLIRRDAGYLGMIGSKRKVRLVLDDLRNAGVDEEAIRRVHAPIGLDIGSQTVPEIAVSIAAELVAVRNRALRQNPDAAPASMSVAAEAPRSTKPLR
jgi:xanthine dehydrogenase accessory factor